MPECGAVGPQAVDQRRALELTDRPTGDGLDEDGSMSPRVRKDARHSQGRPARRPVERLMDLVRALGTVPGVNLAVCENTIGVVQAPDHRRRLGVVVDDAALRPLAVEERRQLGRRLELGQAGQGAVVGPGPRDRIELVVEDDGPEHVCGAGVLHRPQVGAFAALSAAEAARRKKVAATIDLDAMHDPYPAGDRVADTLPATRIDGERPIQSELVREASPRVVVVEQDVALSDDGIGLEEGRTRRGHPTGSLVSTRPADQ